jgi:hypothetical protein
MVGWLGDEAKGGARWRLLGGGHWNPGSGEEAVQLGQQMGGQALVVRGEGLGVLRRHRKGATQGAHRGGANGGSGCVSREGEHGAVFKGDQGSWKQLCGHQVGAQSQHGRGVAGGTR